MIIDDEVRAALDMLRRHAAGNDFELHRIDVLERDLTAPPVAEQVDEMHQRFNGFCYAKDRTGHYRRGSSIHQDIWHYYYGDIPNDGTRYEVHHDDWNPANNDAANLVLLTSSEHRKIHGSINHLKRKTFTCEVCGKTFEAYNTGTNRFCSQKCRDKAQYEKTVYHKTCIICGAPFDTHNRQTVCCSEDCSHKYRNMDCYEVRTCPFCKKEFTVPKSSPNIFCSSKCSAQYREAEKRGFATRYKKCAFCGKDFIPVKKRTKCCSAECGIKYREQHRVFKCITKICPICGKEFTTPSSENAKTCSHECGYKLIKQNNQRRRHAVQPELPFNEC